MQRLIVMCQDALIAALILIPLYIWRNETVWNNRRKAIYFLLGSFYLAGMYSVAGLPDLCYVRLSPNYNIRPFAYMFSDPESSLLNILLFVPLGVFLTLTCESFRKMHKTLLFGFCLSMSVEILQIFTYRASDINDLMTNTAGTFLGWCIGYLSTRWKKVSGWTVLEEWEVRNVCLCSFGVMFFLHPFLEGLLRFIFLSLQA